MTEITSRKNPLILEYTALRDKKARDESNTFIFEGIKLFREALASGVCFNRIFVTRRAYERFGCEIPPRLSDIVVIVTDEVYDKLSGEKSPEGILCGAKYIDKLHFRNKIYIEEDNINRFMLVSVRDPGNLGTCIRTAAAFGIGELVLSSDCADIYNPRCIRASMGALFRQRITVTPSPDCDISLLREFGVKVYAAALSDNAELLSDSHFEGRYCFAVGNEGHGLPEDIINACTKSVIIPMEPGAESLNASVASSILMWEGYRMGLGKK